MQHGMSAFRHRNYRLFFVGQAISLAGTWMQQVAQSWLVLVLTHDPLWLGVVAAAQFIPVMIFGLFGGVLADNLPKRQTLLVTQAVKMGLSVILAVIAVTGYASIPLLILLAPDHRHGQLGRHAGPPGVRRRDGRARGHRQRGRAQLGDVQRGTRHRPGDRRSDHRGGRGRDGVRDRRRELPGGHRRPGADARQRAALAGGHRPSRLVRRP